MNPSANTDRDRDPPAEPLSVDDGLQQLLAFRVAEDAKKQVIAWAKWLLAVCGLVLGILGVQFGTMISRIDDKIEQSVDQRVQAVLKEKTQEIDRRTQQMVDQQVESLVRTRTESSKAIEDLQATAEDNLALLKRETDAVLARFEESKQKVRQQERLVIARYGAMLEVSQAEAVFGSDNGDDSTNGPAKSKFWKRGSVLKIAFLDGNASLRDQVQDIATQWTAECNLSLDFTADVDQSDIRITFAPDAGYWSYVGTDSRSASKDQPTMALPTVSGQEDKEFRSAVLLYFGHALGLIKEYQQPDANIPWDRDAVYAYFQRTYAWSKSQVDHNVLQTYEDAYYGFHKPFDPESVMMHPFPKELFLGDFELERNSDLSEGDKRLIKRLYPFNGE